MAAVIVARVIEQADGVRAPVVHQRQIAITKHHFRVTAGGRNQAGEQQGSNQCDGQEATHKNNDTRMSQLDKFDR